MKKLLSMPGRLEFYENEDNKFWLVHNSEDGHLYDINGTVIHKESLPKDDNNRDEDDPWDDYWVNDTGLEEILMADSVKEVEWEIDDGFGLFGYKNRAGEYVIEPQYAYAHQFTCGLAAVNLNRTWYRTEDGRRFYENHCGYINARGETVIPFAYSDAFPFNKYRVAVVWDNEGTHLIDTAGKIVPGTEKLDISHYYDYDNRFLEFTYADSEAEDEYDEELVGLYDTKGRRILLEPSVHDFIEWSEDNICLWMRNGEHGHSDFTQYYINSKGEMTYPWLMGKGFAQVKIPNKSLLTVVGVSEYTELSGNPSSYFEHNGKKYERTFVYGVYSSKERFVIPLQYDEIKELADNVFACKKDGVITIFQAEESDF